MVGQNIGKYRVLDRIGRGGMGTVYRAIDETLHRDVAIKVLNAELNDPEVAKRFRAEAITVARLSHPGIATIYELFQHEGQWLMVMEFVRGETLEHMSERMGQLSPQRAAELCMQALAALAHAHSMGVVHRDLKPANLMITETGAIKIMDFGIARVAGTEHLTSAGFMMGTPAYMAPEQVMGKEIDARADLYSLGVVFYRLTTAKLPFKGDTPFAMAQSQVNDPPTPIGMFRTDLPPWVESVVVKALAKAPDERFQSAIEFHEAFARCLAGLPMAVTYSSSAPTELMMTPPRAMPTGALYRTPTPVPTSYPAPMPAPAATGSVAAGAPPASLDPGLAPTMMSGPQEATSALAPPVTPAPSVTTSGATSTVAPPGTLTGATPAPTLAITPPASPIQTGSVPAAASSTGAMPAAASPTATSPVAIPAATTTGATPAASTTTDAPAAPSASTTAATPATKPVPKVIVPATASAGKSGLALAGIVVVLFAIAGGGGWWWRTHRPVPPPVTEAQPPAPAPETPPPAATEAPAPDLGAATPAAGSTATPGTPTTISTSPDSGRGSPSSASGTPGRATTTPPGSPTAPVPTTSGGRATPADPTAAPPTGARATGRGDAGRPATPAFDDTHEVFQNIRLVVVNGKRTTDREVILGFGGGQISLLGGAGGTAIASVPYKSVTHATYVHGRDPKWSETDTAPPKDLDVGSFMRTAKHWLVLQSADRYVILRLDDRNVRQVLDTVGTRTGLTIDRPQSNDK